MKRLFMLMAILFTSALILGACGEDQEASNDSESEEDDSDDSDIEQDGAFKIETEDQLDLGIGDTGKFDTTLGTYEVTLDDAKLIGKELDGEETLLENLIVLDLTVKNTNDKSIAIEDLLEAMRLTDDLEGSGSSNGASDFDSIDEMTGDIEPNEEISGQLIFDVYQADEYYFRKSSGNIAGGSSNQVIWTIKADKLK